MRALVFLSAIVLQSNSSFARDCPRIDPAALGTEVAGECAAIRSAFGCNYQVDGGRIAGYACVD